MWYSMPETHPALLSYILQLLQRAMIDRRFLLLVRAALMDAVFQQGNAGDSGNHVAASSFNCLKTLHGAEEVVGSRLPPTLQGKRLARWQALGPGKRPVQR